MSRALVVFHGRGAHWWQRLMRPGFRHCFAVVEQDGYWILFDPRPGLPELRVVAGANLDLAAFYLGRGFAVAELERDPSGPRFPLMPATCVGAVKRLIGLRAPLVLTPWRLYRRLARRAAAATKGESRW